VKAQWGQEHGASGPYSLRKMNEWGPIRGILTAVKGYLRARIAAGTKKGKKVLLLELEAVRIG